MSNNFNNKMKEMEKKIVGDISGELDGRIAIAISKSVDSFISKIENKERNMVGLEQQFNSKLEKLREDMRYESAMEIQKQLIK